MSTTDSGAAFAGRKVLLTGAAGTLGSWLAEAFAGEGAVLGLSDSRADRLEQLDAHHRVTARGGFTHATELTDDRSIAELVAIARQRWGAPDILVNNAGVYPTSDLLDTGNVLWDRIFDVNLRSAFILTRDVAAAMIERGIAGSVVNVTSGGARVIRPGLVPYCVSKAALERLTRGFALELGAQGIRVNAVSPGFMPQASTPPEAVARHARETPLGRHARPGDATAAILYLCSSQAGFVTGTMIDVDGGYHLTAAAIDRTANANNIAHAAYADRQDA